MADKSSPSEWLPAGWSWTVKTSKNGRKYKVYTDPSHKLKFLSKPEVIRYLNSVGSSLPLNSEDNSDDSGHSKSLEESKEIIVHSDKNSPATDQGNEVQDGGTDKTLMSNEEILTPAITEDHICLQYPNSDQSRSDVTGSDLNSESTKSSEQIEGKGDTNLHMLVSSPVVEANPKKLLDNGVNKSNSKRSADFPRRASKRLAGVDLDPEPMKLLENEVVHETGSVEHRKNKSNAKRSSDFPRRASKRLAGIELDPMPEPKTDDRTRRSTAQHSGEAATSSGRNTHDLPAIIELPGNFGLETMASEQQRLSTGLPLANLANSSEPVVQEKHLRISEERAGEIESSPILKVQAGEKKPEMSPILKEVAAEEKPLPAFGVQDGDTDSMMISEEQQGEKEKLLSVSKEQAAEKERSIEIDAILESSTNFSMEDLWLDPCIEFAIKTLTGVIPIGEENQADKNSGSSAEMSFPIGEENQADKNSGSSAEMSFPIGEENQADKNSGSSAEMSFSDIWMDPCYQFAVKTLTGALPLDEDPSTQNLFQHQLSSADTRGVGGTVLPNMNNFYQTDYASQHCNAVEKPQNSKQQATAASRIPQTSTRSLQISGGSGLHQSIQDGTSGQHP